MADAVSLYARNGEMISYSFMNGLSDTAMRTV